MNKIRIATILGGIALALGAAACGGGHITPVPVPSTFSPLPTPHQSTPTPVAPTTEPTSQPPVITLEQKNANQAAVDYLDSQGFSRKGLIEQLSSSAGDGYPKSVATKAVGSLDVDWNAQAVRVAKDYLTDQHFSHQELLGQLKYEGFTSTQAAYGVKGAGL